MTDDREGDDAADWLSAQFGSHESDEPKKSDSYPGESNKDASDAEQAESDTTQGARDVDTTPSGMPTPASPAAPTSSAAPTPPAPPVSGGFSWGLTPRIAAKESAATTPTAPPEPAAQTAAPAEPDAPQGPTPPAEPTPPATATPPAEPTPSTPPVSAAPPFSPPRLVPAPSDAGPVTPPPTQPPVPEATEQPPASLSTPAHPDTRFAPPPLVPPPLTSPVAPPAAGVPAPPVSSPLDDLASAAAASQPSESGLSGTDPQAPDAAASDQPVPAKAHRWPFSRRHDAAEASAQPNSPDEPGISEEPGIHGASDAPDQPEPFDASLGGAPSAEAEPPTMALPWESAGTELFTPVAASDAVAEPATELLSGFDTVSADAAAGSSIDSLFGESQFRDYEVAPAASLNPFARSAPAPAVSRPERLPVPRSQKVLLWIAGVLAALLVLIALFYLGTKIPQSAAVPAPTPTATRSPTPSPTPTAAAVGPVAPGTYKWNRLLGGECLAPFDSPWAEKFTVVDCATPHPAQMVARGVFAEPAAAASTPSAPATPAIDGETPASSYPGIAALQAQINLLCSAPAVIDYAAAGAYTDIQFVASYPATEKQWADGDHSYYCFVTRSSGEPLTTSVAVAPAAPAS